MLRWWKRERRSRAGGREVSAAVVAVFGRVGVDVDDDGPWGLGFGA